MSETPICFRSSCPYATRDFVNAIGPCTQLPNLAFAVFRRLRLGLSPGKPSSGHPAIIRHPLVPNPSKVFSCQFYEGFFPTQYEQRVLSCKFHSAPDAISQCSFRLFCLKKLSAANLRWRTLIGEAIDQNIQAGQMKERLKS